jgi:hypothetical protein
MLTRGELGSPKRLRLVATVVAAGAEFDATVDKPGIEPVDAAAVAARLAEIAHARPRPFAKAMTRSRDARGHALRGPLTRAAGPARSPRRDISTKAETRDAESPGRCAVNDYAQE